MKRTIIKEIEELHQAFENWVSGKTDNTKQNLSHIENLLAPNFRLISPDGINHHLGPLMIQIKNSHGSRPDIKIEIKNIVLRFWEHDHILAIYEEWQTENEQTKGRISTVIFRQKEENPNGLEWVQVHETWLTEPQSEE